MRPTFNASRTAIVCGNASISWDDENKCPLGEEATRVYAGWVAEYGVPVDAPLLAPLTTPALVAIANLQIVDGEVLGVETASGFSAAFALEPHVIWVFFTEPQPDTDYIAVAQAAGNFADITEPYNSDYIEIVVTDRATREPAVPVRLSLSIQRVR